MLRPIPIPWLVALELLAGSRSFSKWAWCEDVLAFVLAVVGSVGLMGADSEDCGAFKVAARLEEGVASVEEMM